MYDTISHVVVVAKEVVGAVAAVAIVRAEPVAVAAVGVEIVLVVTAAVVVRVTEETH